MAEQIFGTAFCRRLGIYRLPKDFLLSVVIPVYNELNTIEEVISRVRDCGVPCELILVDDGSTDGTRASSRNTATSPTSISFSSRRTKARARCSRPASSTHAATSW